MFPFSFTHSLFLLLPFHLQAQLVCIGIHKLFIHLENSALSFCLSLHSSTIRQSLWYVSSKNMKTFIFINPQIPAAIALTLNTPVAQSPKWRIGAGGQIAINIIYILTKTLSYYDLHNKLLLASWPITIWPIDFD